MVMFFGVAIIVWVLTFTQLGGTKYTERISKIGFLGGIVLPVIILFIGLIAYFSTGGVSQIKITTETLIPNFKETGTLVIFASFILGYMGVEASASHVNELKNPTRTYPSVMIVLTILTIVLDALGGLAIATTLPDKILNGNLSYGVIEAFEAIFTEHFGSQYNWLVLIVAILLALGVLAEISSWIVGPSKTVILQAIIVTIWDAVLCGSIALAGGSDSSVGYLTAIGLTVVIYLVGYILFFLGYFVLILKKSNLKRTFQVPGGKVFKIIVATVGLLITIATLIISFFPSSKLTTADNQVYQIVLIICFIISLIVPIIIYSNKHRWATKYDDKSK